MKIVKVRAHYYKDHKKAKILEDVLNDDPRTIEVIEKVKKQLLNKWLYGREVRACVYPKE